VSEPQFTEPSAAFDFEVLKQLADCLPSGNPGQTLGWDGAWHSEMRMLSDNVLVVLEPPPKETKSGIAIVHTRAPGAREHRTARVLAVGPGHYSGCKSCGGERTHLIPTELKPGDRIVVDAMCGNKWDFDVSSVRSNPNPQFDSMLGERGDFRVIREAEALAVLEEEIRHVE